MVSQYAQLDHTIEQKYRTVPCKDELHKQSWMPVQDPTQTMDNESSKGPNIVISNKSSADCCYYDLESLYFRGLYPSPFWRSDQMGCSRSSRVCCLTVILSFSLAITFANEPNGNWTDLITDAGLAGWQPVKQQEPHEWQAAKSVELNGQDNRRFSHPGRHRNSYQRSKRRKNPKPA